MSLGKWTSPRITSHALFPYFVSTISLLVYLCIVDYYEKQEEYLLRSELKMEYNESEKIIVAVTPTFNRSTQIPDMLRLTYTLMHIRNLHWIVIEDATTRSPYIERLLVQSGIKFAYIATQTIPGYPHRGWSHRNVALKYIYENYRNQDGVLYFADDDNTYDIRLFDQYARQVETIGFWAVGLAGTSYVEAPIAEDDTLVGFKSLYLKRQRKYAIDMAGFAINFKQLHRVRPFFDLSCAKRYKFGPETCFLEKFKMKNEEMQVFGHDAVPKEIFAWHTKTLRWVLTEDEELFVGPKHGFII